jgi:hypothetical protein
VVARDDDRMRVRVSLDPEALIELRFEERVECVLALTERIDLSSHRAFLFGPLRTTVASIIYFSESSREALAAAAPRLNRNPEIVLG